MARLQPIQIVGPGQFRGISSSILAGGAAKARRKERIAASIAAGFQGFVDEDRRIDQADALKEFRDEQLGQRKEEFEFSKRKAKREMSLKIKKADFESKISLLTGGGPGTLASYRDFVLKQAKASGDASAGAFMSGADVGDIPGMERAAKGAVEAVETTEALKPGVGKDPKEPPIPVIDASEMTAVEVNDTLDAVNERKGVLKAESDQLKRQLAEATRSLHAAAKNPAAGRNPDIIPKVQNRVKVIREQLKGLAGRAGRLENNERRLKQRGDEIKTAETEIRLGARRRSRGKEATQARIATEARRLQARATERGRVMTDAEARIGAGVSISMDDVGQFFDKPILGEFKEKLAEHEMGRVSVAGEEIETRVPPEVVSFAKAKYGNAKTDRDFKEARDEVEKMAMRLAKVRVEMIVGRKAAVKREREEATEDFKKAFADFEEHAAPPDPFAVMGPGGAQKIGKEKVSGTSDAALLERFVAWERAVRDNPVDEDFLNTLTPKEELEFWNATKAQFNLPANYEPPRK